MDDCVFQNCMSARRSLETKTLQSIMKFDALRIDDYLRANIQFLTRMSFTNTTFVESSKTI